MGERTGGDGIGISPAICVLPNSGLIFSYPQEMGLFADGTCDFDYGTAPDIEVPAAVGSDLSSDGAVQAVVKQVGQ